MLERCRFCGNTKMWKAGVSKGKQRYKCCQCGKNQTEVDGRVKYSDEERERAVTLYLEGNGYRRISTIMGKTFGKIYRHQTIQHWVKNAGIKRRKKQNHELMDVVEKK